MKKQVWWISPDGAGMKSTFGRPRCFCVCQGEAAFRSIRLMNMRDKIIAQARLAEWRQAQQTAGRKVVATNGCFDVLHPGHATYLEAARRLGDVLLVGLTNDRAVRALKGPGRPVNPEADRAFMLAALQSVDAVCIFAERDAIGFLQAANPDVYVKGGDYTLDTINQDERRFLEAQGCRIMLLPGVPGQSTTALLDKIARL